MKVNKVSKLKLIRFLKSPDFFKGLILALAILIPLSIGYITDNLARSLSIAIGVLLGSSPDIPGSRKHRINGILAASSLAALLTLLMIFAHQAPAYVLFSTLGILTFGVSLLSVYGFRASLVTFGGLLAMVLSFAHSESGWDILLHSSLIFTGGIWYMGLSLLLLRVLPVRHTEILLGDCIRLTSKYMRIRSEMVLRPNTGDKTDALLDLQVRINEMHETLREILLDDRRQSGESSRARRYLMIFIELVDIMEFAVANPVDFRKAKRIFGDKLEYLQPYGKLIGELALRLNQISHALHRGEKHLPPTPLEELKIVAESNIDQFIEKRRLPQAREGALYLTHLSDYANRQLQKVNSIERILGNLNSPKKLRSRPTDADKFLTHQDYSPQLLLENFSLDSPILRHALRLSITVLCGYALGSLLNLQNTYWVMLTIMVIMRPGYGLTKQRSFQRMIGTFIGAAVAIGIVLITANPIVYGILAIFSLIFAFSFMQKNYRTSAAFITLNIVFVYALFQPNAFDVIQFRILDTLLGAALAVGANALLFPAWEYRNINKFMTAAIEANQKYLEEVNTYYHEKGKLPSAYKLSRKQAFLAMGNLSAAFQRMAQEPKSKRYKAGEVYEIVALCQSLLSATASLGTYIQHHPTGKASADFDIMIQNIIDNLNHARKHFEDQTAIAEIEQYNIEVAAEHLEEKYEELVSRRNREILEGKIKIGEEMRLNLLEARVIIDQLKWMTNLSANLRKTVRKYQRD